MPTLPPPEFVKEWRTAGNDPLLQAIESLTADQWTALIDEHPIRVISGGNRSGKSRTACIDLVSGLLDHPTPDPAWYSTTTYDRFLEGPWPHLQSLLLYPGESIHKPSARIDRVEWLRVGLPKRIVLRNGSSIVVKSYEQGPGEFQAAQLSRAVIDEECPDSIWTEIQARFLAAKTLPKIVVAATPVLGVAWLAALRVMAEEGKGGVSHHRLRTEDNPGHNVQAVAQMKERFRERPEELRLRLEGFPFYSTGLVYPDGLFKAEHVSEPFYLDPGKWGFWRFIDPGFSSAACLWVAVSLDGRRFGVYRDYIGKERSIPENVAEIQRLSRSEGYQQSLIDPFMAQQSQQESGDRIIDLYKAKGVNCTPWLRHQIMPGIEKCKDMLSRPGGFFVFSTCEHFLRERRHYRWKAQPVEEDRDARRENPVDRDNHCMDCWRGAVMEGLRWSAPPDPVPPKGSVARVFWDRRHPAPKVRL